MTETQLFNTEDELESALSFKSELYALGRTSWWFLKVTKANERKMVSKGRLRLSSPIEIVRA